MLNDDKNHIRVIGAVTLLVIILAIIAYNYLHQVKPNNNIQEFLLDGFSVECAYFAHSTASSN